MFRKKLSEVLGSQNAFVAYLSIILLATSANGVVFAETPESLINLFSGKDAGQILTAVLINFLNPAIKLIKKLVDKQWSWDFINSDNFVIQVGTVLTLVVSAFLGEETAGILLGLAMQVYNFVKHLLKKE